MPDFIIYGRSKALIVIMLVTIFIFFEWVGRKKPFAIHSVGQNQGIFFNYIFYFILSLLIILFARADQTFIYFQF